MYDMMNRGQTNADSKLATLDVAAVSSQWLRLGLRLGLRLSPRR